MQKISLNPNIDIIRKYFFTFYANQEEYLSFNKEYFIKKLKEMPCYIDLNIFKELLHNYNLLNNFDNLLYAGLKLQRLNKVQKHLKIENIEKEIKKEKKRIYELLLLLKYFFTKYEIDNTQIKILNIKDKKERVVINDMQTIEHFMEWACKEFISILEYPDTEEIPKKITIKTINKFIEKYKPCYKKGRKHEKKFLQEKVYQIWNFLQNETHIKAEAETIISNDQCRFIYDYLRIFELIEEYDTASLAEEYIRTLLVNRRNIKPPKSIE